MRVERGLHRLPGAGALDPGPGRARGGEADQPAPAQQGPVAALRDRRIGEAVAEHAVDIALQHRRGGIVPEGIEDGEKVDLGQQPALFHDILARLEARVIGDFPGVQAGVKAQTVKVTDHDLSAGLTHALGEAVGHGSGETAPTRMGDDQGGGEGPNGMGHDAIVRPRRSRRLDLGQSSRGRPDPDQSPRRRPALASITRGDARHVVPSLQPPRPRPRHPPVFVRLHHGQARRGGSRDPRRRPERAAVPPEHPGRLRGGGDRRPRPSPSRSAPRGHQLSRLRGGGRGRRPRRPDRTAPGGDGPASCPLPGPGRLFRSLGRHPADQAADGPCRTARPGSQPVLDPSGGAGRAEAFRARTEPDRRHAR